MNTSIGIIKQLRSETGAGVMECRQALEQSDGRYETALAYLRQKAMIKAEKQAHREARQGRIELYSHANGRIGVMVEVNTETEFAARSQAVRSFGRELALQITANAPLYVRDEDIPAQVLEAQAQEAAERARQAGKPEAIVVKIVQGVLEKYMNQSVLLRQAYLRDESISVAQLLSQVIAQVGENVVVRRFVRWEITPDDES